MQNNLILCKSQFDLLKSKADITLQCLYSNCRLQHCQTEIDRIADGCRLSTCLFWIEK